MRILTAACGELDLSQIQPEQIELRDLSAIQLLFRFTGQTSRPWSVASHSCFVADIVSRLLHANSATWSWALLHDAHEAYLGDLTVPLRESLGVAAADAIMSLSDRIDAAIIARAGLRREEIDFEAVELADSIALASEIVHLFPDACSARHLPAVQRHWPLIQTLEPPEPKKQLWRDTVLEFWPGPSTPETPVGGV